MPHSWQRLSLGLNKTDMIFKVKGAVEYEYPLRSGATEDGATEGIYT